MNLHELNEKPQPWGLVHPYDLANVGAIADEMGRNTDRIWQEYARELMNTPLPDYQRRFAENLRFCRNRPAEVVVDWGRGIEITDGTLTLDTVEVQMRGTRQDNRDALAILRELEWQYARVVQWRARPVEMQRVAFTLTRWEWDTLRQSLDWYELERHMGHQIEGAAPTYRGYPLVIR